MSQQTQFGEAEVEVFGKIEKAGGETRYFRVTDPDIDPETGTVTGGNHEWITEDEYKAGAES